MEKLKQFSIDDIELFREDDDVDFSIAKLYFMAEKSNSHRNPISLEVLKRDAHTVLGKFVIGDYNKYRNDVTTHTPNQTIFGYVPPNSEVKFEVKNGKTFAVAEAVISKLYATQIYKLFKENNHRSVSCEFSATEGDMDENGETPITGFHIHSISVLGLTTNPSIEGAEMKMMKFSEKEAEDYYSRHNETTNIHKFAEARRKKMEESKSTESNPINTSKITDAPWDGNKAKHDAIKEKNFISIAPKIFMRLEDGWKDKEVTKLGYPVMMLEDGEWVYSKKGLASALGYAKKENETEVISKVEKLYRKFDLDNDKEEEEKKMETKNFAELEGRPLWAEVIKRIHSKLGDHLYVEGIYSNKVVVRNEKTKELMDIPAKISLGKDDEDMSIDIDYDKMKKSEVQKDFAEKKMEDDEDEEGVDKKDVEKDEDDVDADEDDKEEEEKKEMADPKEETKKFSLDVHADMGAYLEMLEHETEQYRELAKELWESKDYNVMMEKCLSFAKECDELRKFKQEKEDEAKKFEVDKIMADVKGDVPTEKFEELREQGMACKFSELNAWKNTVKAFAYESSKNKKKPKKDESAMKFGFDFGGKEEVKVTTAEDIFKKYL